MRLKKQHEMRQSYNSSNRTNKNQIDLNYCHTEKRIIIQTKKIYQIEWRIWLSNKTYLIL